MICYQNKRQSMSIKN